MHCFAECRYTPMLLLFDNYRYHTNMYRLKKMKLNYSGLVGAVVFYGLALTPSLLPRPPLYMGLIAGISAAIGYSLGVLFSFTYRYLEMKELPAKAKHTLWRIIIVIAVLTMIGLTIQAAGWQNEVRILVGEEPLKGFHLLFMNSLALGVFALLLFAAKIVRCAQRWLNHRINSRLPRRLSKVLSVVIVAVLVVLLLNSGLYHGFLKIANDVYSKSNQYIDPGLTQPISTLRSGSKDSFSSWETLGKQGRAFVARGPSASNITALTGEPAQEPIRVYVGLETANDTQKRADLALKELIRTNAFARQTLVVVTPTGTGWIEPQAADSLEYVDNGNTAMAAIQYSYLPSWISFISDMSTAEDAGITLFNTVYRYWNTLPQDSRPKLYVYGLSLGSFGSQSPFGGIEDIQARTDGALFMGTPNNSQPWKRISAMRSPNSPQWQPVVEHGVAVRFASTNQNITNSTESWHSPRILYVQHGSDPVVWWSPDLIFHEPDWLKEPRAPDVSTTMHWIPFVTFLQVTIDQFFGTTVPVGHGHNYSNVDAASWSAIINDPTIPAQRVIDTQHLIDAYAIE